MAAEASVRKVVWDAANRVSERMDNDGYLIDSIIAEFEPLLLGAHLEKDNVNKQVGAASTVDDLCVCGHTLRQHAGKAFLPCTVLSKNGFFCPCVDFKRSGWSLTSQQREAIANLAATFFEKSDDLIAVSSQIESVIERRMERIEKWKEQRR